MMAVTETPDNSREACIRRMSIALAVLQTVTSQRKLVTKDAEYVLRQLAESEEECDMDSVTLARRIMARDSERLKTAKAAS